MKSIVRLALVAVPRAPDPSPDAADCQSRLARLRRTCADAIELHYTLPGGQRAAAILLIARLQDRIAAIKRSRLTSATREGDRHAWVDDWRPER